MWNIRLSEFRRKIGFTNTIEDECTYYKKDPLVIVATYVDDGLIFSHDEREITSTLSKLKNEFEIHAMNTNKFLGLEYRIEKDGSIILHQNDYIKRMIFKYNMSMANPVECPCVPGFTLGEGAHWMKMFLTESFWVVYNMLQHKLDQTFVLLLTNSVEE